MEDVPESKDFSFPRAEEQTLAWWDECDAFGEQLRRTEGGKPFVFYDGPPFATGLPHYGHLLAGTIKVCLFFPLFFSSFSFSCSFIRLDELERSKLIKKKKEREKKDGRKQTHKKHFFFLNQKNPEKKNRTKKKHHHHHQQR